MKILFLRLTLFVCVFLSGSLLIGQIHEWTHTFQGDGYDHSAAVVTDYSNDVIVTGWFSSLIDFDPGPGVANETSSGGMDIFVLKMDQNGNYIWSESIGGIHVDEGYDLDVDANNNIYLLGVMMNTVDFDPGGETYSLTSSGLRDIFLLKLDQNGDFLWARNFGSAGNDYGYSIAIDSQGNSLITGKHAGIADLNPGPGVYSSGTGIGWTSFVVKLDPEGNFLWAASLGPDAEGYSVATDSQDNIILTGNFSNTIDFDPGSGTQNVAAVANEDIYVLKLNPDGQFDFVKTWGSSGIDKAQSVLVDQNDYIYVSGYASGAVLDMDPGLGIEEFSFEYPNESFLLKMNANGEYVWARHLQGRNNFYGHSTSITSAGNIATAGYFNGTHDFDPGPGEAIMSAVSSWDVYLQLFDNNGDHLWVKSFGGDGLEWAMGVDFDLNGNLYLAGYYESSEVDFNPDNGSDIHANAGWSDIFIQKYAAGIDDGSETENESIDHPVDYTLNMPNVISGNGDDLNDVFIPVEIAQQINVKEVSIYNRWGNLVYEADSFDNPWSGTHKGKQCPGGTYFWLLKYEIEGILNSRKG